MKLISWNVNGIRSVLRKDFGKFVQKEDPDILCLQETKMGKEEVKIDLPQYQEYWNSPKRPGYSGTAIFTKIKPLGVTFGIHNAQHDDEGRVITAEYKDFYLICVYTPNSKRDLSRLGYRQQWDKDFLAHAKKLEKKKPVVFCGDLNVAHTEIDLTHPNTNRKNHGFTDGERAGFDEIIKAGFLDSFREFQKAGGHYTWWSQMNNCRKRNIGWRIDYFCISKSLRPRLKSAKILSHVMGSDHCPIAIELR